MINIYYYNDNGKQTNVSVMSHDPGICTTYTMSPYICVAPGSHSQCRIENIKIEDKILIQMKKPWNEIVMEMIFFFSVIFQREKLFRKLEL